MREDVPGTFALNANWLFQDKGSQMTEIYTEFIFCSFRSVPLKDLKVGSHPEINPLSNNILFNRTQNFPAFAILNVNRKILSAFFHSHLI